MNTAQLRARAEELTEQLRKIDEAIDTLNGEREAEEGDLPTRGAPVENLQVFIDGTWHGAEEAVELTRAALHEIDLALEAKGVL